MTEALRMYPELIDQLPRHWQEEPPETAFPANVTFKGNCANCASNCANRRRRFRGETTIDLNTMTRFPENPSPEELQRLIDGIAQTEQCAHFIGTASFKNPKKSARRKTLFVD